MNWKNFRDKCTRYFWFPAAEWRAFIVAVLALSVVVSWNNWGGVQFDAAAGAANFLKALLFLSVTVFVHHAGQRLAGLWLGFYVEQRVWWYGLMISAILALVTNGVVQFLAVTSTVAHVLPMHRLGRALHGPNLSCIMKICTAGPLFNIFFGGVVKTLSWVHLFPAGAANELFVLNMVFAAWNLLPIPPLDGSRLFYYSRMTYVFSFAGIAGYALLIYVFGKYSYIFAGLLAIGALLAFYVFFESKWG